MLPRIRIRSSEVEQATLNRQDWVQLPADPPKNNVNIIPGSFSGKTTVSEAVNPGSIPGPGSNQEPSHEKLKVFDNSTG